jgi:hypothetical protein
VNAAGDVSPWHRRPGPGRVGLVALVATGLLLAAGGAGLVTRAATSGADAVQVVDTLVGTAACAAGLALAAVAGRARRRAPAACGVRGGRDHPAGAGRTARLSLDDREAEMRNVIPLGRSADAAPRSDLRPASGQPWPAPRAPRRLFVVAAPAPGDTPTEVRSSREDGCRPRRPPGKELPRP